MFIGIKELERGKLDFEEVFPPGSIDFRTREFRQAAPLTAAGSAELAGTEIHVVGRLATRLELLCARCLEPVLHEAAASFDLLYRPVKSITRDEELSLAPQDTDVGFYTGQGLFLADVLAEQVNLSVPMKVLCNPDCRGLCPRCGANLNRERCRCGPRAVDPRLAPLAKLAERKKQGE
ncbi:MAG: DUF177 domain-containing protein [Acidobacteria bacterium]|nr:DUF177 domain-containing protein [Acidobacteriota bacterium]